MSDAPRYTVRYSIAGYLAWVFDEKLGRSIEHFESGINEHGRADSRAEDLAKQRCAELNQRGDTDE